MAMNAESRALPEVGLSELWRAVRRYWLLVVVPAIGLALLGYFFASSDPVYYKSTAHVIVYPLDAESGQAGFAEIYRTLLRSDRIIERTTNLLVEQGTLQRGERVAAADLSARIEATTDPRRPHAVAVLALTARARRRDEASAKVNAWAEAFIEESQSMFRGGAAEMGNLLTSQLEPTRDAMSRLANEKVALANDHDSQVTELRDRWDRQIAARLIAHEKEIRDYHAETQRLMQDTVTDRLETSEIGDGADADYLRREFFEIVNAYWRLARTPRLVRLEKSASEDLLTEYLATGRMDDILDGTVTTEESNPLYSYMAVEALRRVAEFDQDSDAARTVLSAIVTQLDTILLTRTTGLSELMENHESNIRSLQRQQALELRTLERKQGESLREIDNRIDEMVRLEGRLQQEVQENVVAALIEQAGAVSLAGPASVARPEPRRTTVETASWGFLGGLLGLCIALALSFRFRQREDRAEPEE